MHHERHQPKGMILFFVLIVFGVTAMTVALLLGRTTLSAFLTTDEQVKAAQVRAGLMSCLDEVLVHFPSDPNYAPTSISVGTVTCTATISTSGNQRTVALSSTSQGITRKLTAVVNVNVTPVTVASFTEP